MRSWTKWLWSILWLIGLFALSFITSHLQQVAMEHTAITFNMSARAWFETLAPFLFGLYLSLICVRKWSFQINWPLLVLITLPCLVVSLYIPIAFSLSSTTINFPMPIWLLEFWSLRLLSIVAGLSLIIGLFGSSKQAH